jgi:hypothetical protein
MQMLLRWLDRKQPFRNTASGNPKLVLGLLHEVLCLLKFVGDRVKGPLAIMFDVNLVAAHGFDYDAGLFHERHYAPQFDRFPVRAATGTAGLCQRAPSARWRAVGQCTRQTLGDIQGMLARRAPYLGFSAWMCRT